MFASPKFVQFLARQLPGKPELMAELADLLECSLRTLTLAIVPEVRLGGCGGQAAACRSWAGLGSCGGVAVGRLVSLATGGGGGSERCALLGSKHEPLASAPPGAGVQALPALLAGNHRQELELLAAQAGVALPRLVHDYGHCVVARQLFQGSTSFDAYIAVLEAVTGQVGGWVGAAGRKGRCRYALPAQVPSFACIVVCHPCTCPTLYCNCTAGLCAVPVLHDVPHNHGDHVRGGWMGGWVGGWVDG